MTIKDKLIEPYQIEVTFNNFSPFIPKKNKRGKIEKDYLGHYTSLDYALKKIAKKKVIDGSDDSDLASFTRNYLKMWSVSRKVLL